MRSLFTWLLPFLFSTQAIALNNGPVLAGSLEERLISKSIAEVLTTPTGCRIAETFFLLKEKPLRQFFGINAEAARTIKETCPGTSLPSMPFLYQVQKSNRPAKTYTLNIDSQNQDFHGWTSADNKTHIFLKSYDSNTLRSILAHEILITMDDKFHLQTKAFAKLGLEANVPPKLACQIDRFLGNPYYQSLLASLRAFRMELRFASELNDSRWLSELQSYAFLSDHGTENFELFTKVMKPFEVSILRFYSHYYDNCGNTKFEVKNLSDDQIKQIIQRDYQALKRSISATSLNGLMDFLILQMAISSSDSNIVNTGPRPVIGTGGWSNEGIKLPENIRVTIPQNDSLKDHGKNWEKFHKERYDSLLENRSKDFKVPTQEEEKE